MGSISSPLTIFSGISYFTLNKENSIWRRSRLDMRSGKTLRNNDPEPGCWPAVFVKTMVCCRCLFLQAQKNWFCPLLFKDFLRRSAKTTLFALNAWHNFYPKRPWELVYIQTKTTMADDYKFEERCSCLTISVLVPVMESCHLLRLRNKRYSNALGRFLSRGNCHFTAHLLALHLAAVISIERRWVQWCIFLWSLSVWHGKRWI